ncbi:hypothetical protein, partial [Edaphobacter aggregans]|uniref:hypothetical protein n=1 Tax=Edaphobacter aggregans TaxID=570835 RepID=UPI00054E07DD
LLVRGDDAGATAALQYSATRLPYLWETGKRYASVEEIRDDLRRFFGQKSDVGQAAAALYHLDQWSAKIAKDHPGGFSSVRAEIDVDLADPGLKAFARKMLAERLHASSLEVVTGNLHAGVKCCDREVPQHLKTDVIPFKQGAPTFSEDLTFPWEGKRMQDVAKKLIAQLPAGQEVVVQAGVSESPQQRLLLAEQLRSILKSANVKLSTVEVLSAYKQGYSWIMDSVAPALAGRDVAKVIIEFAPYCDPKKQSTMRTEERWIQQLYPVDELLAAKLKLPLESINFQKMGNADGPTYRVHGFAKDGKEVLTRDFTVYIHNRPYSGEFHQYEQVGIETGWVTLTTPGGKLLASERVPTDTEEFWEHYQDVTLPKIIHHV